VVAVRGGVVRRVSARMVRLCAVVGRATNCSNARAAVQNRQRDGGRRQLGSAVCSAVVGRKVQGGRKCAIHTGLQQGYKKEMEISAAPGDDGLYGGRSGRIGLVGGDNVWHAGGSGRCTGAGSQRGSRVQQWRRGMDLLGGVVNVVVLSCAGRLGV
jgi:hypothetical protein